MKASVIILGLSQKQLKNAQRFSTYCNSLPGIFIFILIGLLVTLPGLSYAYMYTTHRDAAQDTAGLLQRNDPKGLYQELYYRPYLEGLKTGAQEQDFGSVDGNARGFRHYYDPDARGVERGVQYHDYYKLWEMRDFLASEIKEKFNIYYETYREAEVNKPASGYYENALDWARNSSGAGDFHHWEGAIQAYDYTESSRKEAYVRLGHVVHLLQDMAEPDHVFNIPHPGSENKTISANKTLYGFERLIMDIPPTLSPKNAIRRPNFDAYYNDLARLSKKRLSGSGLTVPLGVNPYFLASERFNLAIRDIAWDPDIDYGDKDMVMRYMRLAQDLLTSAAEFSAGLEQDFYDIVNRPPYVKRVIVIQDMEEKYNGGWQDELKETIDRAGTRSATYHRLVRRTFSKNSKPVKALQEATMIVEFGSAIAPAPVQLNPASIQVSIDSKQVPGKMLNDTTWEGTFTLDIDSDGTEKELPIKIYAADTRKHYPRPNLPLQGYPLDADPESPAKIASAKPPYLWQQYEPGRDENHVLKVIMEQPPIVQCIEVFSEGACYLRNQWEQKGKTNMLRQDPSVSREGLFLEQGTEAVVALTFNEEVADESVQVLFGPLTISMNKTGKKTFEGIIPLYQLNAPGLDTTYRFSIQATGKSGLVLDAKPQTVAFRKKGQTGWDNLEKGADTFHSLRVYGRPKEEALGPVVKGVVYAWPERDKRYDEMQSWLRLTPDWRPKSVYAFPAGEKLLAGFNVLLGIGYFELEDKVLFDKFMRLANTRIAVGRKLEQGIRKITKQEFEACRELLALKETIMASAKFKSGSLPGWMVTTDQNGEFSFALPKYPGKDGILYCAVNAVVFPPVNTPMGYYFTSGTGIWAEFYPVYTDFDNADIMKINTRQTDPAGIEDVLLQKMNELKQADEKYQQAQRAYEKAIKEWGKKPEKIEKTWSERAVNEQRKLEKEYAGKYGPAQNWKEDIRKKFELDLAAIPEKAKQSWNDDVRNFKEKMEAALAGARESLEANRTAAAGLKSEVERLKNQDKTKNQPGALGMNFSIPVTRSDKNTKSTFVISGKFSGNVITPNMRMNAISLAFLIPQTVSADLRKSEWGLYRGMISLYADLDNPKEAAEHKAPYEFKFSQPLDRHLVVYEYREYQRKRKQHLEGGVCTVFGYEPFDSLKRGYHLKDMWFTFMLPPIVEVEGYDLADRKRFGELWADLEKLKIEEQLATKKYQQLRDDFHSGKISYEEAKIKMKTLKDEFYRIQVKGKNNVEELKRMNAAFRSTGN